MSLVIERIAAETGYSEIAIIRHGASDKRRTLLLCMCRNVMFKLDGWVNPDAALDRHDIGWAALSWMTCRDWLLHDIERPKGLTHSSVRRARMRQNGSRNRAT